MSAQLYALKKKQMSYSRRHPSRLAPGSRLQFTFVPDILADGAYDEAVKDVKYIIHIASPIAKETEDYERDVIQPAVKGTTNILKSALKAPTVKRIVITSSILAVIPG